MKILKGILAGALSVALVCFGWFGHSWLSGGKSNPTPKPTPPPIVTPIVNPDDNNPNQVIVDIGGSGTTGEKKSVTPSGPAKNDNKLLQIIADLQKRINDLLAKTNTQVAIDKTMPVTGSITAKFIEKKTNADLGSETKPLTGTATVKGTPNDLSVKMDFSSQLTFSVNIPKPEPKLWTVGAYYEDDDHIPYWIEYAKRDFPISLNDKYTLTPYLQVDIGGEKELIGGFSLPIDIGKKFTFNTYGELELGDDNESILGAEVNW